MVIMVIFNYCHHSTHLRWVVINCVKYIVRGCNLSWLCYDTMDKHKKTVDGMQQVLSLELWGELQLQSTYRQRLSIIRWRAKSLALTGRFIQLIVLDSLWWLMMTVSAMNTEVAYQRQLLDKGLGLSRKWIMSRMVTIIENDHNDHIQWPSWGTTCVRNITLPHLIVREV